MQPKPMQSKLMQSKPMLYEENEIAHALGLTASSTPRASGVSIDSRTIKSGEVFFALQGERCNGAEFVEQALARGAACAVVEQSHPKSQTQNQAIENNLVNNSAKYSTSRLLQVDSPLRALNRLAAYARSRTSARIIAITGSVGKTSLRALLENILPAPVAASLGNQNNHIGVPLSLARMPKDSKYGVFELGMNHAGEIDSLASLVRPHIAIITAISAVHTEFLEDEFAVCDAKAEVFKYVSDFALIPASEKFSGRLIESAKAVRLMQIHTFGSEATSDYRLCEHKIDDGMVVARALLPAKKIVVEEERGEENGQQENKQQEKTRELRWRIAGCSQARALAGLCALALCDLLNLALETIAERLEKQQPLVGRGAIASLLLERPARQIRVIDESYNSSPLALSNALASLESSPHRRIAALGDMLELGERAAELHKAIAPEAARYCDLVFTCGESMYSLHRALPRSKRGAHRENARALASPLLARLKNGDTLLVKGSLASGMQDLLENLKQKVAA